MHLYVQMWKVRTEWLALNEQERLEKVYQIGLVIKSLIKNEAQLVGFSLNDFETPNRADFRYVAVWKLASGEMAETIEAAFESAGWSTYFESSNGRGELVPPQHLLRHMVKL